jgi:hypothetical protein
MLTSNGMPGPGRSSARPTVEGYRARYLETHVDARDGHAQVAPFGNEAGVDIGRSIPRARKSSHACVKKSCSSIVPWSSIERTANEFGFSIP